MTATYVHTMPSLVGELTLLSDGECLTGLYMRRAPEPLPTWRKDPAPFATAVVELEAYFAGELTEFTVPVAPAGTPFQKRVWAALLEIPYGTTSSYRDIAERIGAPTAVRAVGMANGRNPVSIIVPCHRVIGANGSLTGYGGGLANKELLLELERRTVGATLPFGAAG